MAQVVISPETMSSNVKIISGELALDGGNPTPISVKGKMTKVVAVILTQKEAVAPGVLGQVLTYNVAVATPQIVNVYSWKPTSNSNPTLVADTGTKTFSYTIIGY